jgi:CCR4-NOT transcription complex subunit 4
LAKQEYFAQYGTITKIVVNKNKAYDPNGPNGPSFSAYITYSTPQEASIAILSIDNIEVDGHLLRASFGTTKYCTFFLKSCDCPNKDCLYLHYIASEDDIIHRVPISLNLG